MNDQDIIDSAVAAAGFIIGYNAIKRGYYQLKFGLGIDKNQGKEFVKCGVVNVATGIASAAIATALAVKIITD